MAADTMKITITEDGLIKIDTDRISLPNHRNCEQFVQEMARLAGGSTKRTHKHGGKMHSHTHNEEHNHEGH
jgi:hypothetical protein